MLWALTYPTPDGGFGFAYASAEVPAGLSLGRNPYIPPRDTDGANLAMAAEENRIGNNVHGHPIVISMGPPGKRGPNEWSG